MSENPSRDAEHAGGGWTAGGYPPVAYPAVGQTGAGYPGAPPTAPPSRTKWMLGAAIGLVVGALVAGTLGFVIGASTADDQPGDETSSPSPDTSLRPYEAQQMAVNKEKFSGDLAVLAEPWLPWVGACAANTDPNGPKLPSDEKVHVFCRYGNVSVHFAEYNSAANRDDARAYRNRLNLDGFELAPGMEQPARKRGGSTNAQGNYVEYAFRGSDDRALCGIWWDRDDSTSAAFYLETLCQETLGGKWEPLRDLWQRYS